MAHRLLPFRQYDENDVVNLFALDISSITDFTTKLPSSDGINADGVLVKVSNGDGTGGDVNDYGTEQSDMFATYSSPVGRNPYPFNPLRVAPATAGDSGAIGLTLNQTLHVDENGEKLLFNPVKKDELQAVLSGQTVPVISKGIVTLNEVAFDTVPTTAGDALYPAAGGKLSTTVGGGSKVATVLSSGTRTSSAVGTDSLAGNYFVIKLDC